MAPPKFKEIAGLVATLSLTDQAKLASAIKARLALGETNQERTGRVHRSEIPDDVLFVLASIAEDMRKHGADFTTPDVLYATAGITAFRAKVPAILEFIGKHANTDVRRRALLKMGIELLRVDLEDNMQRACTSILMMAHAHRIPAMINRAFPGYARNGLLHLVFAVKGKPNDAR